MRLWSALVAYHTHMCVAGVWHGGSCFVLVLHSCVWLPWLDGLGLCFVGLVGRQAGSSQLQGLYRDAARSLCCRPLCSMQSAAQGVSQYLFYTSVTIGALTRIAGPALWWLCGSLFSTARAPGGLRGRPGSLQLHFKQLCLSALGLGKWYTAAAVDANAHVVQLPQYGSCRGTALLLYISPVLVALGSVMWVAIACLGRVDLQRSSATSCCAAEPACMV